MGIEVELDLALALLSIDRLNSAGIGPTATDTIPLIVPAWPPAGGWPETGLESAKPTSGQPSLPWFNFRIAVIQARSTKSEGWAHPLLAYAELNGNVNPNGRMKTGF
jgi:hypothetical protein